jgi:hypothetical protein
MKLKRFSIFFLIYILALFSVLLFMSPSALKELPIVKTYGGELQFSGKAAFKNLKTLVYNYPDRKVGSENAGASAQWINRQFDKMGLQSHLEEFTYSTGDETADLGGNPLAVSLKDLYKEVAGINVVGVSKGETGEVILVGAHRDIAGSVQGAEDNGTGTVTMLELARVLTTEPHYYTYMFVSFDGEETGLNGSAAFVRRHVRTPFRLAFILDMTGYKDSNTVGFYQYVTGRGASPLWTHALAKSILDSRGLPMEFFLENDTPNAGALDVFTKLMSQRVKGMVNTDSGPFVDRNIPAVGIMAARTGEKLFSSEGDKRIIHNPGDKLEQVSAETMTRVGQFAEQYIRSMELNEFTNTLAGRHYVLINGQYISAMNVIGLCVTAFLLVLALLAVSLWGIQFTYRPFTDFLHAEKLWLGAILLSALVTSGAIRLLGSDHGQSVPLIPGFLGWLAVLIGSAVAIPLFRFKFLKQRVYDYHMMITQQKLLLNMVYGLFFLIYSVFYSPFLAISIMLIPLFVMGRAGYRNLAARIFWIACFGVWTLFHLFISFICVNAYVFDISSAMVWLLVFLNTALWLFTLVYIVSAPPMKRAYGTSKNSLGL